VKRQAHDTREALEERRARQRGFLCELGHCSGSRDVAVHLLHCWRESRIGQAAQQARGRPSSCRRPQRFDQQNLHKTPEHEVAARSGFTCCFAYKSH
jgi:hypothetical protein